MYVLGKGVLSSKCKCIYQTKKQLVMWLFANNQQSRCDLASSMLATCCWLHFVQWIHIQCQQNRQHGDTLSFDVQTINLCTTPKHSERVRVRAWERVTPLHGQYYCWQGFMQCAQCGLMWVLMTWWSKYGRKRLVITCNHRCQTVNTTPTNSCDAIIAMTQDSIHIGFHSLSVW